jgi:cytochrome oxidase Cu insertion factor (SCO1/SenC/PrrC family)
MRVFRLGVVSGLFIAMWTTGAPAQRPMRRDGELKVGGPAADFTIQDVEGKKTVKLSDLKGKPVVLIFGSCT